MWFRNRRKHLNKKEKREIEILAKEFDSCFYQEQYPDIRGAKLDFVEHYYFYGWKEGRDPCKWFNTNDYLKANPDIEKSGSNAFVHFLVHGRDEGRSLKEGKSIKRASDRDIIEKYFEIEFYENSYPDIKNNGIDALDHFLSYGWKEGRNPCSWFSISEYLEEYPDVKKSGVNPFIHYIEFGQQEDRTIFKPRSLLSDEQEQYSPLVKEVVSKNFDEEFYLRNNKDIRDSKTNPLEHYLVHGWREGRNPVSWFSTAFYLENNPDVRGSGVNAFYHYLVTGRAENRAIKGCSDNLNDGIIKLFKDPDSSLVVSNDVSEYLRTYKATTHPNKTFNRKALDIHWVIPDFSPGAGGHMTIFRMVRFLELFGHKCTIWVWEPTVHKSEDDAYETIIKHFQTIKAEINFITEESIPIKGDGIIATAWQTVNVVNQISGFKEKFYFVQDYEPSFYAKGSLSLLAEQTYRLGLSTICASPWLKHIIENKYSGWARTFMLAYDHLIYNTNTTHNGKSDITGKTKIAVYSRVGTERRSVELVFAGLEYLARERDDFEVHLFGGEHAYNAAPFECYVHGVLSPKELAALYGECNFGICFSATNYSLVPQEMMASGLPVLELNVESTRAVFPEGVVSFADPNPKSIAKMVENLIDDLDLREAQAIEALTWVENFSWEASARDVENAILEKLDQNWKAKRKAKRDRHLDDVKVSVIIPVFNGGELFTDIVLPAVKRQCAPWRFEIIVIDSSSNDGTGELLQSDPNIKYTLINKSEFQHGRTRNMGVEVAKGEFVAFLTQDAIPANDYWLYNMVTILEHFPKAAGAFGKHTAHDGAGFFTRREIEAHFEVFDSMSLSVSKYSDEHSYSNDNSWRQKLRFYSDNSSCLRKSVWKEIPYREIEYGEDQVWASDIIDAGYAKVYAITSLVKHSHDYSLEQVYERSKIDGAYFKHFWGDRLLKESDLEYQIAACKKSAQNLGLKNGLSESEVNFRIEIMKKRLKGHLDGQGEGGSLFSEDGDFKSPF